MTDAPQNTLTQAEKDAGWILLFDGQSMEHWRGFRAEEVPDGWKVVDGTIAWDHHTGDIITREQFEDFELRLEWRNGEKGNSGIFFGVSEDHERTFETGPEFQIIKILRIPLGR